MPVPGSNIRLLRKQLGYTLRSFAEELGMDVAGLSRIESGKGGYSHDSIERIAKKLAVSVGVLFSDPGAVEAATLRMRQVPILSAAQLRTWEGPDSLDAETHMPILHGSLDRMSRYVFGLVVEDDRNAPHFVTGDELIFDAKRKPKSGGIVAGIDGRGRTHIGRLRILPAKQSFGDSPGFEIWPYNVIEPSASTIDDAALRIRGVLVELRRYFE